MLSPDGADRPPKKAVAPDAAGNLLFPERTAFVMVLFFLLCLRHGLLFLTVKRLKRHKNNSRSVFMRVRFALHRDL